MKWHFSPLRNDQVETEVTQRDQFDNDDVDISETIVREFIQNSLDAAVDDPYRVRVSFRWVDQNDSLSPYFFKSLFAGHGKHGAGAGLSHDDLDFDNPRALVIEDFGTCGLTGNVDKIENAHFCDFWRRHGKSNKTGKSRGRWGLGKLVYSCSSQAGIFFGATRRADDEEIHVMGQTVLNLRTIGGKRYPPHAFFADIQNEDDPDRRIPVPVKDAGFVSQFIQSFSLERHGKPGLSIIIPFPRLEFSREKMIEVAIANYFYPLITGQLVLAFGDIEINRSNVRHLAKEYAANRFNQIDLLFDFIEELYQAEQHDLLQLKESWVDDRKLDADDFDQETLEKIREQFTNGQLVGLYLPITIKRKTGGDAKSGFSVYIKRPDELTKGVDLYVRGGLTLPNEAKMGERQALGAMIAEQEAVCAFLGDAENAAHTKWITNTEKLRKNYRNTQTTITVIKKAVIQLYDLLCEVTEDVDEDALNDFFWFTEPENNRQRKRRKKPQPPPQVPDIPRKPPIISLSQVPGGFVVASTSEFTDEHLPHEVKIEVAYEVGTGNAFKKYSPHDFKLGKDGVKVTAANDKVKVLSAKHNTMELQINQVPFQVQVHGFDSNRDLKVKVR